MANIDVSVITPTYRREKEVVDAVRSALRQEGVRVEAIVIDDTAEGTAREAVQALGDERVRYQKREIPSKGRPATVRNDGARLAQGRYLHFLDDDDTLVPGALRDLVQALDARPDRGVAIGRVVPFGDDPDWLHDKRTYFERVARIGASTPSSLWTVAHILFLGTLYVNSACMVRRELFEPLGGFDATIPVYEDVDFHMRAARRFGHVYVDRPVLNYRTGKPSLMHDLGKDDTLVRQSYAIIHRKYKEDHGMLEYLALQLATRLLPFSWVRRLPFDVGAKAS